MTQQKKNARGKDHLRRTQIIRISHNRIDFRDNLSRALIPVLESHICMFINAIIFPLASTFSICFHQWRL